MPGLPYAVPSNYVIRLVEEGGIGGGGFDDPATTGSQNVSVEPVQPHPAHPSHFEFPRRSLHELTLTTHFRGPHTPGSVSAPKPAAGGAAWVPATDIRETMRAYHIEIETPGVTDKEQILIQWMSPHTILVQGEARRPKNIGLLDETDGSREWEGEGDGWPTEAGHGKEEDGAPLMRTPSRETIEAELLADSMPTVLLGERRLGSWRRTFTLPDDVEMKELRARLVGGLLRLDLPKRSVEDSQRMRAGGVKIEIE